jgi:hypothetical protein
MFITFLNIKGIVRFEFIPQGQAVNQFILCKYSSDYVTLSVEKCLNFRPTDIYRDSTTFHKAVTVKQFWLKDPLLN